MGKPGDPATGIPTPNQLKHGHNRPPKSSGPWPDYGPRPPEIQSRTDLKNEAGRHLCGSLLRRPGRHGDWICHTWSFSSNGRCRMHGGGAVPKIFPEHLDGRPVTGSRRLKLMQDLGLSEKFASFRDDPKLAELRDELAMVDFVLEKAFRRVEKQDNPANRKEFLEVVNARRKLVDSVHKNTSAVITVPQALAFMYAMINLMFEFLPTPTDKGKFLVRIRALSGKAQYQFVPPEVAAAPPVAPAADDVGPEPEPEPAMTPDLMPPGEGL